MFDVETCDIQTLFMYRYALDKPIDTVDLTQDVRDLQYFPERLADSYEAEWLSYVKRELHALQSSDSQRHEMLLIHLTKMQKGDDEIFNELIALINIAIKVNDSSDVAVLTTPLRAYVQQLLKV